MSVKGINIVPDKQGVIINLYVCVLSHVQLFATPWTVVCKVPLSMEFPWQ